MPQSQPTRTFKRAANLSIDSELLSEARRHNINISRAAEIGIAQALAAAKSALWKKITVQRCKAQMLTSKQMAYLSTIIVGSNGEI